MLKSAGAFGRKEADCDSVVLCVKLCDCITCIDPKGYLPKPDDQNIYCLAADFWLHMHRVIGAGSRAWSLERWVCKFFFTSS